MGYKLALNRRVVNGLWSLNLADSMTYVNVSIPAINQIAHVDAYRFVLCSKGSLVPQLSVPYSGYG